MSSSNKAEFYNNLNEQLAVLETTKSFDLDFDFPLCLDEVKSLSFRLTRRNRTHLIRIFELTNLKLDDFDGSLVVLEELMRNMPNLEHLLIGCISNARNGGGEDGSITHSVASRIVQACNHRKLIKLSIIHWDIRSLTYPNSKGSQEQIHRPWRLENLCVAYISEEAVPCFVLALSQMRNLRTLAVGLGNGTTDAVCGPLLDTIAGVRGLSVLYLWAPDSVISCRLTYQSLRRINKIVRRGCIDALVFENLPGLFRPRTNGKKESDAAFNEFLTELRNTRSLRHLSFREGMLMKEPHVLSVFQSLENNGTVFHLRVFGVTMSVTGWSAIGQSLKRNHSLTTLDLQFTNSASSGSADVPKIESQMIVDALQTNTSITDFKFRHPGLGLFGTGDDHDDPRLVAWRRRNKCLQTAEKILPLEGNTDLQTSDSGDVKLPPIPVEILPMALWHVGIHAGGGCNSIYAMVKNFATRLVDSSNHNSSGCSKNCGCLASSSGVVRRRGTKRATPTSAVATQRYLVTRKSQRRASKKSKQA